MLRRAEPDDASAILEMSRRLYAEYGEAPFDHERASTALADLLQCGERGLVLVTGRGNQVQGYAVLAWGFSLESGGRCAVLDEIYVGPEARGQGLGSALIDAACAHCRQAGARELHLVVERANPGAERLYRRQGFAGHDRTQLTRRLS